MSRDRYRPEWLRRCDAVNATEQQPMDEDLRLAMTNPLFLLGAVTIVVVTYPFVSLYRWLRREE